MAVEHLAKLNERVYIQRPFDSDYADVSLLDNENPLHIICGWMGGPPRVVSKYAQGLTSVSPYSHILIICSFASDFFASERAVLKSLQPAVDIIQDRVKAYSAAKAVGHLHMFSNGGTHFGCLLAHAIKHSPAYTVSGPALPVTSMCVDSAPSRSTVGDKADRQRATHAFVVPFKKANPLIRYPIQALFSLAVGVVWLLHRVGLFHDVVSTIGPRLMDSTFFPLDIPRLYIYSSTDELISHERVGEHVQSAADLIGKQHITSRVYHDSGHVAHAKVHGKAYWHDVCELLRKAEVASNASQAA